jgi:hypothetical protein
MNSLHDLIGKLHEFFNSGVQGFQNSPAGALAQGQPQQVLPRLQQRVDFFAQHPQNISLGGDMQPVNPGGFAGALPFNTRMDQMTSAPMSGPSLARSGLEHLKAMQPSQESIGQMQVAHQSPDLTMYEQALNTGNNSLLDRLAAAHPGDARFSIHQTLLSIGGKH